MDDRHDPVARLRAIGREERSALTGERLAAIEARVLATGPRADEAASRRLAPLVVAAAAVVLLVVVASVTFGSGRGQARFEVADGVILELPGDVVVAAAGDDVPDGAVVEVAPGGMAVIDGERFGPGRYRVDDGRLIVVATTSTTVPASPELPPSTISVDRRARGSTTMPGPPSVSTATSNVPVTSTIPPTATTANTRPRRVDRTTTSLPSDRTVPPSTRDVRPTTTSEQAPTDTRPPTTTSTITRPTATTTATTTTVADRGRDRRP